MAENPIPSLPKLTPDQEKTLDDLIDKLGNAGTALDAMGKMGVSVTQHQEIVNPLVELMRKLKTNFGS